MPAHSTPEPTAPIRIVEHTRDPAPVAPVLHELRTHFTDAHALAARLREVVRTEGLRVFGAHIGDDPIAAAAVTVRIVENLAFERFLYVDDLVTSAGSRGRGLAGRLMDRVDELAREAELDGRVQLDSGVQDARADAHSFYFSRGMRIASYHFAQRAGR